MMHDPPHPGEILQEDYLEPLGLSVTEAAAGLGMSRRNLSEIIHGRRGVSPAVALRFARAFDTSPELWMNLQAQFELWHARQSEDSGVVVTPLYAASPVS